MFIPLAIHKGHGIRRKRSKSRPANAGGTASRGTGPRYRIHSVCFAANSCLSEIGPRTCLSWNSYLLKELRRYNGCFSIAAKHG